MKRVKSLIVFLLIMMLSGASFAQELSGYSNIKLLEASLEGRIRNELTVSLGPIDFNVSVRVVTSRVNVMEKGEKARDWQEGVERMESLPGLYLNDILAKKLYDDEDSTLDKSTAKEYIDHIEVTVTLDEDATRVQMRLAESVAIDKADLVKSRGDQVTVRTARLSPKNSINKQLALLDESRKEMTQEKSELKKMTLDFMDMQNRTLRQFAEDSDRKMQTFMSTQVKEIATLSDNQKNIAASMRQLGTDLSRKIDNTQEDLNMKLENSQSQAFFWGGIAIAALILFSLMLYAFNRISHKGLQTDIQGSISSLKSELASEIKSATTKPLEVPSTAKVEPERLRDLNELMIGRKRQVKDYIKSNLQSDSGKEKISVLASQLGTKTLERLFPEGDIETIQNIRSSLATTEFMDEHRTTSKLDELYNEIVDATDEVSRADLNPYTFLNKIDDDQLLLLIEDEDLGIKAMVLSQLSKDKAGRILETMSIGERLQVTMEMADMRPMGEREYMTLSQKLLDKLLRLPKINKFVVDGSVILADAINMMAPVEQYLTLSKLKSQDPSLFMKIGENTLFFDDIFDLPEAAVKDIFAETDMRQMAMVIYDSDDNFRNLVKKTLNERRMAMITEQIQTLQDAAPTDEELKQARYTFIKQATRVARRRKLLPRIQG